MKKLDSFMSHIEVVCKKAYSAPDYGLIVLIVVSIVLVLLLYLLHKRVEMLNVKKVARMSYYIEK